MPTFTFSVLQRIYHQTGGVVIEANSLEDAMHQLATQFKDELDPRWDPVVQEMAILAIDKDGEAILQEPGDQSLWPDQLVDGGRVWGSEDGAYPTEAMPTAIQALINEDT